MQKANRAWVRTTTKFLVSAEEQMTRKSRRRIARKVGTREGREEQQITVCYVERHVKGKEGYAYG